MGAIATLLALASTLAIARGHEYDREIAELGAAAELAEVAPPPLAEVLSPVDVNTATEAQLESLPRIGPALAARIVAHRPYRTLEELERVPGIGPRTIEALRPHATVGALGAAGSVVR